MIVLLSRLKKNSLLVSLILNGVFFALYLCLGEWRFGSLDDFFMSSVLVGAYGGQYDVHMYFVNAVYGFVLKPLYMLFPTVGWYSVGESLEVFASFVAITYCILITLGNVYGRIISLLLLVCVLPAFWPDIGFTQCSAVLTAAGIILASCSVLQNKRKLMVLAVVFFVVAMS